LPLFASGGLGLGLKKLVLFTSLAAVDPDSGYASTPAETYTFSSGARSLKTFLFGQRDHGAV